MADIHIVNFLVIIVFFAATCIYLLIRLFKKEMNCYRLMMDVDMLNEKIKTIENGKSVVEKWKIKN